MGLPILPRLRALAARLVQEGSNHREPREDLYALLGVSPDAGYDEIRQAYLRLASVHHPDRSENADVESPPGVEHRMGRISHAYWVLRDPRRRARYNVDRQRARGWR